ncbi:LANO_0F04720g1_1 [Lachancea nothofagi CBS 11611]|uniref:LANO_0F04720g1_1 n=1 Tax=Lachancea nothofagi CBS 11611 TaxID=1266666 RepID=A0A1G4K7R9_9SACH|nr:LANO_0F04720g1_1 [Lachancea nothofagi CBS 11611]
MVKLRCPFSECDCTIVELDSARQTVLPIEVYDKLKLMLPSQETALDGKFSVFEDIWDFDNIGVSRQVPESVLNTVAGSSATPIEFVWQEKTCTLGKLQKYLICADCDRGPLGMICEVQSNGQALSLNLLSSASVRKADT